MISDIRSALNPQGVTIDPQESLMTGKTGDFNCRDRIKRKHPNIEEEREKPTENNYLEFCL